MTPGSFWLAISSAWCWSGKLWHSKERAMARWSSSSSLSSSASSLFPFSTDLPSAPAALSIFCIPRFTCHRWKCQIKAKKYFRRGLLFNFLFENVPFPDWIWGSASSVSTSVSVDPRPCASDLLAPGSLSSVGPSLLPPSWICSEAVSHKSGSHCHNHTVDEHVPQQYRASYQEHP